MGTGKQKVNIYLKKFLPQDEMVTNFLEYLVELNRDAIKLLYPKQGFFYGNIMVPSDVNEVTLETPSLATDGLAHILKLDPLNSPTKFENTLGELYHFGLRYNILEAGTEVNVRTGQIEYTFFQDAIGEKGDPDAIVDNGSTLTLDIDGVTEAGVSNAGRTVIVYLKKAQGQSDAFYNGVVEWVGGKNVVNTTHLIGQTAGLVSVDPADYTVFIVGATVRKNTDLSLDPNIAYVGTVTGSGDGNVPLAGDIDVTGSNTIFSAASTTPTLESLRSFLVGGGNITWDLDTGDLTWSSDLRFFMGSKPINFTLSSTTISGFAEEEAIYFLRDDTGGAKALTKVDIKDVPFDPLYEIVAFRHGDNIYFRDGILELQGVTGDPTVGRIDGVTEDILTYMGAPNESASAPKYKSALGADKSNMQVIEGESLKRAIKRLDLRDDIINKVKAMDFNLIALPSTAAVTIDGQVVTNGDKILFANPVLNGIYLAAGIGVAATWTKLDAFAGNQSPLAMSLVGVQEGSEEFIRTIYQYTSTRGWRPLDSSEISEEPTGIQDKNAVTFSFVEGSRTFTVQPVGSQFFYSEKGKLYKVEGPKPLIIPDDQGLHYIYFDGDALASTQIFTIDQILRKTWVATVYWDKANQKATFLGDSRHHLIMDSTTHAYLRFTDGSQYSGGFGIGVTDGDGSSDTHAQVALDGGQIYNQDLIIDVVHSAAPANFFEQILNGVAELPVYKRIGANGDWEKEAATTFPLKAGTARPHFNNFTGALWETKDSTADGKFVAMYFLVSFDVREPVIAIMGQREDDTLAEAQENNTIGSLSIGDFPTLEGKAVYRVIFETNSTYANAIKARQVDVTDLRRSEDSVSGGFTPTEHNALNGRGNSGAHPTQAISTTVSDFRGALDEEDTDVKKALKGLDDHFKALRILVHPTNKKRVIVTGATVTLNSGIKLEQQIKNLIVNSDEIQIDFETGEIFESDGATPFNGGANDFAPIVPPAGENRWASITMLPSTVNADNTINLQPLILLSEADDFRAAFATGTKLGQIELTEATGSLGDILKANIARQGVGGSGDGGAGDANSFLEDLKARIRRSFFKFFTPNIFSTQEEDEIDGGSSTATYDIANSLYKFATGQVLQTINQLGSRFLGTVTGWAEADQDLAQCEVHLLYNEDAVDPNPVVEVSRDGGNEFQVMEMTRVGESSKYRGIHTFDKEAANQTIKEYAVAGADTQVAFTDTGADSKLALKMVITEKMVHKDFTLYLNKLGAAVGSLFVDVYKDDGGLPSLDPVNRIGGSDLVDITGLATGNIAGLIDLSTIITKPGSYWVIVETDQEYKDNYSTGVDELRWRADGPAGAVPTDPESATFNGTIWALITDTAFVYKSEGRVHDLRVKITSSADDIELLGMGTFYGKQGAQTVSGLLTRYVEGFSGDDNIYEFTIPSGKFLPNPDLLKVFHVETGATYVYPAFDIQGQLIKFKTGDFLIADENVTLIFDQSEGSAFDNSDLNRNLLAANHLGSADASNDLSVAGRGNIKKTDQGTLVESTVKEVNGVYTLQLKEV